MLAELLADSDSDSEYPAIKTRQNKTVHPLSDYSESHSSDDENKDIGVWGKHMGQNRKISNFTIISPFNPSIKAEHTSGIMWEIQ